jgi:hypothetical protein
MATILQQVRELNFSWLIGQHTSYFRLSGATLRSVGDVASVDAGPERWHWRSTEESED